MIRSFGDVETAALFYTGRSRRFGSIAAVANRKLNVLESTRTLADLQTPPGNRLEALKGDRRGQHSIRINDQYRICFIWHENEPHEVQIVDYH